MPDEHTDSAAPSRRGYKRAFDRHPDLPEKVRYFEEWLYSVEQWLKWIEKDIPDNVHISKAEALEDIHMTSLGLRMLDKINVDIYPEGREGVRTEYDLKKLLRAVVAMPTIARLKNKRIVRDGTRTMTIFQEVIDDTLNGRINIDEIHEAREEQQAEPVPDEAA